MPTASCCYYIDGSIDMHTFTACTRRDAPYIQLAEASKEHSPHYNVFTYTTQSSWADATCRLGSFADLLGVQVHNTVTRRPGPAGQHGNNINVQLH